ncbi:MAG: RNA polymerase sigma factor [Desulfuromonas sp.]|nr:MAG: RNA polymerase sigma factor [Desulfuromonas sp.]
MEDFFRSVERQAYRIALFACHNREDALDLVQDSMCQFYAKYAHVPESDRKALFYKILQNKIRDFRRKENVRSRWRTWLHGRDDEDDGPDPLENMVDERAEEPDQVLEQKQSFGLLEQSLRKLSAKQQQIFLLRAWEGLSIAETALAMGCSEGTVKSHYFRATERLKTELGDNWP